MKDSDVGMRIEPNEKVLYGPWMTVDSQCRRNTNGKVSRSGPAKEKVPTSSKGIAAKDRVLTKAQGTSSITAQLDTNGNLGTIPDSDDLAATLPDEINPSSTLQPSVPVVMTKPRGSQVSMEQ
ncbi:hypothetical protein V6N13_025351 [Hibiscus sabdariffa]